MRQRAWQITTLVLLIVSLAEGAWIFHEIKLGNRKEATQVYFDIHHPIESLRKEVSRLDQAGKPIFPLESPSDDDDLLAHGDPSASETPSLEDLGDKIRLSFDIHGREDDQYSVRIENNSVIVSGKGQATEKKITSAPWPFHNVKREREINGEANWTELNVYQLPKEANPTSFKVEKHEGRLAITFDKKDLTSS